MKEKTLYFLQRGVVLTVLVAAGCATPADPAAMVPPRMPMCEKATAEPLI